MAVPTEVFPNCNPQPCFLYLKNDFSRASTFSQRMKREVAEDIELDVFAADEYFSGATDMFKPWKTNMARPGKELSFTSPPQRTYSALSEPTVAASVGWKPPILSLFSWFRKSLSPSSSKENDNTFRETSRATQACNKRSNMSTNWNMTRRYGTVTGETEVDFFRESSSDLFGLNTLSIGTSVLGVQKSSKYPSPGETFGEETAAPVEWGLHQVGCMGRKAVHFAADGHRASVRHRPKKWDSMSRPASNLSSTPRISAPVSALSLK